MSGNLFVVDDHENMRIGIRHFLEERGEWRVTGFARGAECMAALRAVRDSGGEMPQIVIVDIQLSGGESGFDHVRSVKAEFPQVRTVIYSMYDTWGFILQAKDVGADGYASKAHSNEELEECLGTVRGGSTWYVEKNGSIQRELDGVVQVLKKREKEVFALALQGLSKRRIAERLFISLHTVENYVSYFLSLTGCRTLDDMVERFR